MAMALDAKSRGAVVCRWPKVAFNENMSNVGRNKVVIMKEVRKVPRLLLFTEPVLPELVSLGNLELLGVTEGFLVESSL